VPILSLAQVPRRERQERRLLSEATSRELGIQISMIRETDHCTRGRIVRPRPGTPRDSVLDNHPRTPICPPSRVEGPAIGQLGEELPSHGEREKRGASLVQAR
jgi:hypothetical protein